MAPPIHATVQSRTLHRACLILGGIDKLADKLHADVPDVRAWMTGKEPTPLNIFEECVEILLLHTSKAAES